MGRRIFGTPHWRTGKSDNKKLDSIKRNTQRKFIVTPTDNNEKKITVRYRPQVRKIGKNYIEMAQIEGFEPIVFNASPHLKTYKVSPRMLRFAQLLRRTPFAGIRRIGYDIIEI
jgi:hypothetical protein